MIRAARAPASPSPAGRVLVSLLALLLLLTIDGTVPPRPVEAAVPSAVASIRQRQLHAERSMRRADRQIARLERQRRGHAKHFRQAAQRLERAIARRDGVRERAGQLRERLAIARQDRDRQLRVHPSPTGQRATDRPQLRKRVRVLQDRIERLERRADRLGQQVERARHVKQSRAHHAGAGHIAARKQAREHAESVLGSQISLMMALSKERAAARFTPSSGQGFMRPARGRVSQGYGCQARRRGRCLYFHDGIDIAAPSGTRVRASADGYVAFAGWNPWDQGRRSYVVIIGHARGIETIYAHLRPIRMVKAGESVQRGQPIGLVGLTGHTSGPHVHWEVSRGFHSMDPLRAGR